MKKILSNLPGIRSKNILIRIVSYPLYAFALLILLAIIIPSAPNLEVYATRPTNLLDVEIRGKTRNNVPVYLIQNDTKLFTINSSSNGEYLFKLNSLSEGEHSYTVKACDNEDDKRCSTNQVGLTIDRTPPNQPVLDPIPSTLDSQNIIISGEADQNSEVVAIDGKNEYTTKTGEDGKFSINIPDLDEGKNELTLSVIDEANNRSERVTIYTNVIVPEDKKTYKVTKVVDGDTITLSDGRTIRYIGIDTPETVDPRKPVQCYGKEASDKNRELVEGKEVRLEKDVNETDKYGRLLRYVYVGDIFVNDYLVKNGYAKSSSYPPDVKHQEEFRSAEEESRNNKLGMWGDTCASTSPTPNPTTTIYPIPKPTSTTTTNTGTNSSCGGADKDCGDFSTHAQAQAFYEMCGSSDPHRLDQDKDGIACETLP